MFATAAVALSECGTAPTTFYGGPCIEDLDACAIPEDAGSDVATMPFYGNACVDGSCIEAGPDSNASDASDDAPSDAADEAQD